MSRLMNALLFTIILLMGCSYSYADDHAERTYKNNNKVSVMRATLVALQDMGFVIENIDTVQWLAKSTRFAEEPEPRLEMDIAVADATNGVVLQAELMVNGKAIPFHHMAYHNFFQGITQVLDRMNDAGE